MNTVTRSGADYFDVHTGFWINWAHGRVKGSTVTVSRANGGILVAFIAIFVATAGKSFWRILCLFFHRQFTKPTPQDAVYHQRQAILRNSETATFAFWQLIMMLTEWRNRNVQHLTRRILPTAILAITVSAGFSVAGIFSSQITTNTANEVLLTGKNCRIVEVPSELAGAERLDAVMLYNSELAQRIQANLQYSQQCYTGAENDEDCMQYVKPRLPLNITFDAPCPFSEEICKTKSNIIVDSGFLNSNTDLGINLPKNDQFEVRVVNHCAPLISKGYSEIYNDTDHYATAQMRYNYGQLFNNNFTYQSPIYGLSESLRFNNDPTFGKERAEYTIGSATKYAGFGTNWVFNPIAALNKSDADLVLVFLSSRGLSYMEPVDDPWFSALNNGSNSVKPSNNSHAYIPGSPLVQTYQSDEPASPLGCTLQVQVCNPNLPEGQKCQSPHGLYHNWESAGDLWQDEYHKKLMSWVANIVMARVVAPQDILDGGGNSVLTARFSQVGRLIQKLPSDQWQREVVNWMSASMASLQGIFVDVANGIKDGPMMNVSHGPNSTEERKVCTSQRIKSMRYSSFSVLGLSLIVAFGTVLIALDLFLENILSWWDRKLRRDPYQRLEWHSNENLQLQRLAHEAYGAGTWEKVNHRVPVTHGQDTLAMLDTSDEKHPRFKPHQTFGLMSPGMKPSYTMSMDESTRSKTGLSSGSSPEIQQIV